jgi:uncharacterized protein YxjI
VRYILKQKFWTTDQEFAIKNETGQLLGTVTGNVSVRDGVLTFVDARGATHATIERYDRPENRGFKISRVPNIVAWLSEKPRETRDHLGYKVEVELAGDILIKQSAGWDAYDMHRGGHPIARVAKQLELGGDLYHVDVADGADVVLVLATAIAIDCVRDVLA